MKFALIAVLFCSAAFAQEVQIGRIYVTDGGTGSNVNTGYLSAGCNDGETCAKAFPLSSKQKITIQCFGSSGAVVAVNRATNDAGIGLELAVLEKLPTATGKNVTVIRPDGGTYTGAIVTISPVAGQGNADCRVHVRSGEE